MLDIWGLGGNYAPGLATDARQAALVLVRGMGCTWVRDSVSWAWCETPANVAKIVETKAQCDALGLRYLLVFTADAPATEPGGGGGTYPTDAGDFATYLADFQAVFGDVMTQVAPYGVCVGWEMSGPSQWLPDGVATDKYANDGVAFSVATSVVDAYVDLYNAAAAVTPGGVLVGASCGDADTGYTRLWLTRAIAAGLAPAFVAPYDYRNYGGQDFPYWWEAPEYSNLSGLVGDITTNIQYYQALGFPVVIPETGYNIGGMLNGTTEITQAIHASLMQRTAVMAATAMPMACCFIGTIDDASTTSGFFEADWTPRPAYTALAAMLPTLPEVAEITQSGTTFTARCLS